MGVYWWTCRLVQLFILMPMTLVTAQRGGICYDPVHVGPTEFSAETIAKDMDRIKANGFTHVRTFKSFYGYGDGLMEMGPLITQAGLQAALGIPLRGETQEASQQQLLSAIQAAQTGNAAIIFIGNENLATHDSVPEQMLEYMRYAKANVPSHVLVGTVQRNTEFLDPNRIVSGFANLLEECQIIGVNVHPFFTPNLDDSNDAIDNVRNQWNAVMSKYPSIAHKMALTEVGWPSGGNHNVDGGNYGSIEASERFYHDYESWSTSLEQDRKFYFQMYDQPYKGDYGGPEYETKFGIFTTNGTAKFDLPPAQADDVQQETSSELTIPESTVATPALEGITTEGDLPPPSASPTPLPTNTPSSSPPTAFPTETPTIAPTTEPTQTTTVTPTSGTSSSFAPTIGQQKFEFSSSIQTSAAAGATCAARVVVIGVAACVMILLR